MSSSSRVRFGDFEADLGAGELWHRGEPVRVQDLPFRLLAALVQRPGELVTRTELGQLLWGAETFVDFDAGLNTAVAKLREALNDDPVAPHFIETVPKRGYRFIGRIGDEAEHTPTRQPPGLPPPEASVSSAGPEKRRQIRLAWIGVLVVGAAAAAGVAAYRVTRATPPARVAVVLFDNETGRTELDRLAQTLTDSTVMTLTGDPGLAVIGNAAVLRTSRPFRDLERIGRELEANFVIIGQVQQTGERVRVMAHLIRTADQAHVWADAIPFDGGDTAGFESAVVREISTAVARHVPTTR